MINRNTLKAELKKIIYKSGEAYSDKGQNQFDGVNHPQVVFEAKDGTYYVTSDRDYIYIGRSEIGDVYKIDKVTKVGKLIEDLPAEEDDTKLIHESFKSLCESL
jgi:hypothetical protein